jgi:creatinine amidohydrolase
MKRFQLPGIFQILDRHRAVREFFTPIERSGSLDTNFIHADESETSVAQLLFPEMIDMDVVEDAEGLPQRFFHSRHIPLPL